MTRLRALVSYPRRGIRAGRTVIIAAPGAIVALVVTLRATLLAITAQELALAGVVLIWAGFGVGPAGVVLLLIGLGLTLDWTERIR